MKLIVPYSGLIMPKTTNPPIPTRAFSLLCYPALTGVTTLLLVFGTDYARAGDFALTPMPDLVAGATYTDIADNTMKAPGQTTTFSYFYTPFNSGSNVAFLATYNSAQGDGIYTGVVGTTGVTRIADNSTIAPGQTTTFSTIYGPILSGSNVAFNANFGGGSGIYAGVVGTTGASRIADTSMTAPGQTTTFYQFSYSAISGNNVAFFAYYNQGKGNGLFLYHGGSLLDVAETGEPLFGSTISNFGASEVELDGNTVDFQYTLANGVQGEATFMISDVPEPSTWALLGVGAGLLGVTLRRRASQA